MSSRRLNVLCPLFLCVFAQGAAALDDCMVGQWDAGFADLEATLSGTIPDSQVIHQAGSMILNVNQDGTFTVAVEDLSFKLISSGIEGVLGMNGSNTGNMETDDTGGFVVTVQTFDLVTELNIGGQQMTVPGRPPSAPPEVSTGTYVCSETDLQLVSTVAGFEGNTLPENWKRRNGT